MAEASIGRIQWMLLACLALAACQPGASPFQSERSGQDEDAATAPAATSVRLVDRDVEAPEVFQITEQALWDGRPSLGGVWVASPEASDPERVIMRNADNGKFVIGALFRRERDNPGPRLQLSSDAAEALGLLAGEPGTISVTALRREEEAPAEAEEPPRPILDAAETVENSAADEADAAAETTAAIAAAAIAEVESTAEAKGAPPRPASAQPAAVEPAAVEPAAAQPDPAEPARTQPATKMGAEALEGQVAAGAKAEAAPEAAAPAPKPAAAPAADTTGSGGLIQIGIFSVEENAKTAVQSLSKAGIAAEIGSETVQGKTVWTVTARGGDALLQKIKAAGFADAYVLRR